MANVTLEHVTRIFGKQAAVEDVSLEIAQGEFLVLLGPSGCGKTTVLRMIGGFSQPDRGRILIGGEDVTHVAPRDRNIGMVFQSYALFPNLSVAENIVFGLRERRHDKARIARRLGEMLELIQLTGRGNSRINELSGGQQQRVALARAIAIAPRVLLMDEPMAALDLKLRESMQVELRRIQRELGITTVLVTHDQHEAMNMADRIVILSAGRIEQVGSAAELYRLPANPFVAGFIGKNNLLRGQVTAASAAQCTVRLGETIEVVVPNVQGCRPGEDLEISVRPEQLDLRIDTDTLDPSVNSLPATVDQVRFLGNVVHCRLRLPWGQELLVERSAAFAPPQAGATIRVCWASGQVNVFRPTDAR